LRASSWRSTSTSRAACDSTLLGGATAILFVVPLSLLTSVPYEVLLVLGAAFFAAAFQGLRTLFARRAQGLGFRA